MRIWARIFKENHMIRDLVLENFPEELSRTKRVFKAVDDMCYAWDLAKPIWLDKNISEFQHSSGTRFYQDNFPETIEFDYIDFKVIEE